MINFYRKIRHNQLTTKKLGNYTLYAVGEIILVVVGILIALQVNSWQENKKDREQEILILSNIHSDLMSDTTDLKFNIQYHRLFLENEKKLLSYMQGSTQISKDAISFENALGIPLYSILHEASFSNLQNNNLGTITNNTLKEEISRHYDFFVKLIGAVENDKVIYETYPLKLPYFLQYFQLDDKVNVLSNEEIRSKQYYNPDFERAALRLRLDLAEDLKRDEAFKVVLSESIMIRQLKIQFYDDFINRTKLLSVALENELTRLKDD